MSSSSPTLSGSARRYSCPEDFIVEEIPLYAPAGTGNHTFVRVEKRLRNTEEVAAALARAAGVRSRDVGYAGRKDRMAVARQWFSVPEIDAADALRLEIPGVRILEAVRHPHKLRTGQLRGNRFEIRLRDLDSSAQRKLLATAVQIASQGFPNRYGPQRFGRDGSNVARARSWLSGEAELARRDRRQARFLVSALQAAAFNEVLRQRPIPLDRLELGDIAVVHASGGLFEVDDLARENARAGTFEISATGPIFGTRAPQPGGRVAEREAAILARLGVPTPDALRLPRGLRLRGGRRALRVRPAGLRAESEGEALRLRFELPAGSYASVLVDELLGDPDRAAHPVADAQI